MTQVGKHFLSRTQNTLTIKEKIHIFDVINVKNFSSFKDTTGTMKRQVSEKML